MKRKGIIRGGKIGTMIEGGTERSQQGNLGLGRHIRRNHGRQRSGDLGLQGKEVEHLHAIEKDVLINTAVEGGTHEVVRAGAIQDGTIKATTGSSSAAATRTTTAAADY